MENASIIAPVIGFVLWFVVPLILGGAGIIRLGLNVGEGRGVARRLVGLVLVAVGLLVAMKSCEVVLIAVGQMMPSPGVVVPPDRLMHDFAAYLASVALAIAVTIAAMIVGAWIILAGRTQHPRETPERWEGAARCRGQG